MDLMKKSKKLSTKNAKSTPRPNTIEWKLLFYDACKSAGSLTELARYLDMPISRLGAMIRKSEQLQRIQAFAKQIHHMTTSLRDYVCGSLSDDAKDIWNDLKFWEDEDNFSEKVKAIMARTPKKLRQELFVHAFLTTGFNRTKALQMTNTSIVELKEWIERDLAFAELIEEMQHHKKDFFENALIDLVQARNPQAVVFVNKTLNADRGYSEKLQIHHSGNISNDGLNIDDLDLDIETRKKILEAIRKKGKLDKAKQGDIIDIEQTSTPLLK